MSTSEELQKLADLHQRGVLSDEEFARAKQRVIDGMAGASGGDPAAVKAVNGFRRSLHDRWLGGVCGGLGRSTGIASWVWRIVFVLLLIGAGCGVLLYLLLWLFVPLEGPSFDQPAAGMLPR